MRIIGRKKFGSGSVILLNNGNTQRQMRHKIQGSGISNEMFEEVENTKKGLSPEIVRKFEGLKFRGKPKKYIDFNF